MEATQEPVTSTPTPVVETPAPSSAPTPQEPSQPQLVSQPRRISAREALERTATATPDTPDAAKPAGAITPPAQAAQPGAQPQQSVPPEARWPAILDNARSKAATEAVQARDRQWQQEAGWVLQIPPEQRKYAPNVVRDFYANPTGFVVNTVVELLRTPQGAILRQALMPLLGNGHAAVGEQEPQPDVEIHGPDGRVIGHTFSDRLLKERDAFLKKQLLSEVQQQLTPFQREREEAQAREQALRMDREIQANTDTVMTRLTKILGDHREAWAYVDAAMNTGMDAYDAALEARDKFITPNQQARAEQDAAERMRRKANANTSNGAGAVVTPASRPRTAKELSKLMQDMDGAAS